MKQAERVVVMFAGDSGDGMQLTGSEFTENTATFGNDFNTFPNYPAEIRAPAGTVYGVSGFQIHFGGIPIHTPGDEYDVLVAMNAAAFKASIHNLKEGGTLIINEPGFEGKNIKLAGYAPDEDIISDKVKDKYSVHAYNFTQLTRDCLQDVDLPLKKRDLAKNMFVLGFVYWMFHRSLESTKTYLAKKFSDKPLLLKANVMALKAGYHLGETVEASTHRVKVEPLHKKHTNDTRFVNGSVSVSRGFLAAAEKSRLPLFYASYPITPASPVLHYLAAQKNAKTFQAEDEIAAIGAAIGASFGGALAITGTSGPGMALKAEALSLAVSLELPLVVLNVQRAGPSTGMPTKVEQADLFQALYGRHGEAPLVVMAANSPSDAYTAAFTACQLAVEHMVPVVLLTDGYIANSAEPWEEPDIEQFPEIATKMATPDTPYQPYERDENLVRSWALPGMSGLMHRVGGLEKEDETGNVSYTPENHEKMTQLRRQKVERIAERLPKATLDSGSSKDDVLLVGWGSTYGAIKAACIKLREEGHSVAHLHLRFINPLPKGLGELVTSFKTVLVPELNDGQLVHVLRSTFLIDAIPYKKVQGLPFTEKELIAAVKNLVE